MSRAKSTEVVALCFQISTPERFAEPPWVLRVIEPDLLETDQGPSFFQVPAVPLAKLCRTSRSSSEMLKVSELLSSQT